ncbi:MAG: DNA primase [Euryarchaeota archaeon]|nr:DNA primase [Euryarchaeota archaeon]
MGKIDLGTTKYVIHAKINASGVVEKPDVVGAIFGQTEGLLGSDLDLRELQKTGRIGRIDVNVETKGGKASGTIDIPSSMDKVETAILAASLETIDRVGPCEATIKVGGIEDVRVSKRKMVVDRAKDILTTMVAEITPDSLEITDEVKKAVRVKEIREFGPDKLPAGPNVGNSDAIIVVEGRADVLVLLKYGIKNAIAVEGTSIPKTIIDLCKQKTTTVFTDGDRGGELIVRELLETTEIDFVARAPDGKEVEDLTKKEIFKALRNKIPAEQVKGSLAIKTRKGEKAKAKKPAAPARSAAKRSAAAGKVQKPQKKETVPPVNGEKTEKFQKFFSDLSGTLKAYILDQDVNVIKEVAVRDLAVALKNSKEKVSAVIFDGVVTQRLVEIANEKGVEYLIGAKIGNITKKPADLRLLTATDLGVSS